jgi:gas vesicle protein
MKAITILLTTIAAGAIGYAAGTLFAPNKGSKTRNKISKKGHEYADHLSDTYDEIVDMVSNTYDSLESDTARLAKKGKANVKKVAADINAKMH